MSESLLLAAGDAWSRPTAQGRSHNESTSQSVSPRRYEGNVAALNHGRALARKPVAASDKICPNQIMRAFNTWAFKREQPSDPQLMLRVVAETMARRAPLPFLFYWGKGPRCHIDEPDIKCFEYLTSMAQRIADVYEPGAAMQLILTNTHAELNGYSQVGIRTYYSEITAEAKKRGFESCWLGELIEQTQAKAEDDFLDDLMEDELLEKLFTSAVKWYHGDGSAEEGATKYFHMNMVEKRAVELAFPNAIFATFNSSKFRILFPKRLPIFYMYSLQRGVGVKPWFLPAEVQPCAPASCQCIARESSDQS
jgi:L-tyrosine isonitrile synthase